MLELLNSLDENIGRIINFIIHLIAIIEELEAFGLVITKINYMHI